MGLVSSIVLEYAPFGGATTLATSMFFPLHFTSYITIPEMCKVLKKVATNAFQSGTVQPQTPGDVPAFVLLMAVEISLASNFKSFDSNIFILFGILVKIHKNHYQDSTHDSKTCPSL